MRTKVQMQPLERDGVLVLKESEACLFLASNLRRAQHQNTPDRQLGAAGEGCIPEEYDGKSAECEIRHGSEDGVGVGETVNGRKREALAKDDAALRRSRMVSMRGIVMRKEAPWQQGPLDLL